MPGATIDGVDGEVISGKIKVKVGPIALTYAGTARFTEKDEQARVVVLEASGRDTGHRHRVGHGALDAPGPRWPDPGDRAYDDEHHRAASPVRPWCHGGGRRKDHREVRHEPGRAANHRRPRRAPAPDSKAASRPQTARPRSRPETARPRRRPQTARPRSRPQRQGREPADSKAAQPAPDSKAAAPAQTARPPPPRPGPRRRPVVSLPPRRRPRTVRSPGRSTQATSRGRRSRS